MKEKGLLQICEVIDTLLGENGCPWDKKQTLDSLAPALLEEACEAIDAIYAKDDKHTEEELGDIIFTAIFCAKVAEKQKIASFNSIIEKVVEKYIRRHPHIFGDKEPIHSEHEVVTLWEEIKKQENSKKATIPKIPSSLPALSRAKEIIKKLKKQNISVQKTSIIKDFASEEAFGNWLFEIVAEAHTLGYNPEMALRKASKAHEAKLEML